MSKNNEKFIGLVRRYPILYDPSHPEYKNQATKTKQWEWIGDRMNLSGEEARSKWKNLRDTYSKHLRELNKIDERTGRPRYSRWQWASSMEFLREHMSIGTDPAPFVNNEKEMEITSDHFTFRPSPSPTPPKQKKQHPVEKVIWSVNERANKLSSTEHIMLGYAKVIDEFAPQRRIETKMKIAQIIMEAEMEEEEERVQLQNRVFQSHSGEDPLTESQGEIIICKTD
ncbi:hypothetical protein ABMA28_010543 [Loxostege sticticalis]|uniref:MADF domain-containing protein n=1 Tax=Loxostege sticticalis TaxID=481309 RepID=A0ABD0S8K8_LOXSC